MLHEKPEIEWALCLAAGIPDEASESMKWLVRALIEGARRRMDTQAHRRD
jgi:hypothetical protein